MSSKFGNSPVLQKTPKICKVPPEAMSTQAKSIAKYSLQAYVEWTDPGSPLEGRISGQTTLLPFQNGLLHFGTILGDPHSIECDLLYDPDTKTFTYTVQLMIGQIVLATAIGVWLDPNPTIPFKTDLMQFEDPLQDRTVRSRIFS